MTMRSILATLLFLLILNPVQAQRNPGIFGRHHVLSATGSAGYHSSYNREHLIGYDLVSPRKTALFLIPGILYQFVMSRNSSMVLEAQYARHARRLDIFGSSEEDYRRVQQFRGGVYFRSYSYFFSGNLAPTGNYAEAGAHVQALHLEDYDEPGSEVARQARWVVLPKIGLGLGRSWVSGRLHLDFAVIARLVLGFDDAGDYDLHQDARRQILMFRFGIGPMF